MFKFLAGRLAQMAILFVLFHRTAPAAIAGELANAFSINAAVLGTLAATYFYVYTLLQVPVGVLADTLGPRKLLAG
ncbi:MAG TPA: MFS transporter, partial [Thermoanaerobaculia bacterium]|nr:MFS transporter [Thermoanaerobaculia bacterium]